MPLMVYSSTFASRSSWTSMPTEVRIMRAGVAFALSTSVVKNGRVDSSFKTRGIREDER